jgi:hypothetical protein
VIGRLVGVVHDQVYGIRKRVRVVVGLVLHTDLRGDVTAPGFTER